MRHLALAMIGGALGSGVRHLVNVNLGRWLGAGFPWWTLFVNVTGCFMMGALIDILALRFNASNDLRVLLATGVLGGYTTFSAYSLDFAFLLQRHDYVPAVLYLVGTVVVSILAFFAAQGLVRWALA